MIFVQKMARKGWNVITSLFKLGFGPVEMLAEAAGDAYVLEQASAFIEGREPNETTVRLSMWIGLGAAAVATIPSAITMVYYWIRKNHPHQPIAEDLESPIEYLDAEQLTTEEDEPHHHHEGIAHELMEFGIIGVPFGLLAYGGVFMLLKPSLTDKNILNIAISSTAGLACAWGNYQLHSFHAHASEGYFDLLRQLPDKKCKAVGLSLSVLFGHLAQGFLDAQIFLQALGNRNKTLEYSLSFLLGGLVTFFEGRTEMRSTLLQELNRDEYRNSTRLTKCLLLPAAFLHGLLPTVGALKIAQLTYNLVTEKVLTLELPLAWRISLLGMLLVLLNYPNARGFYCTTLPATNEAFEKLGTKIVQCRNSLFRSQQITHTGPSIVHDSPAQLQRPMLG